jgi:hypothetical protein
VGQEKQDAAVGKVLTRMVPVWLRVVDARGEPLPKGSRLHDHPGAKFAIAQDAARKVRRIFKLSADGHGIGAICAKLNAEGVPSIGRLPNWCRSFVCRLLSSRAVLGEFVPGRMRQGEGGRKRAPDGEPIKDYFPPIIDEKLFLSARGSVAGRRSTGGWLSPFLALFSGLIYDACDGGPIHRRQQGPACRFRRTLVS